MLTLDGSQGEGGGQILRTALSLALVTGTPFRITNIRAGRDKPGLMRQHATAVAAAQAVGNAEVDGGDVGSSELTFKPRAVSPGPYRFPIGTAGSTMLVLQTVLPPLLTASGPSVITLEGGTHNRQAPPFDFIDRAFLPLINRMGPRVSARLERHGFYPAGGGRVVVEINPVSVLTPLALGSRGGTTGRRAAVYVSRLARQIAEREIKVIEKTLGWSPDDLQIVHVSGSDGPGNAVALEIASEHVSEVFSAIGEVGKSAEAVAAEAVRQARAYIAAEVAAGPYLADQLLLPLAMAGSGEMLTMPLTPHSTTNIETIRSFLKVSIEATAQRDATVRIVVRS